MKKENERAEDHFAWNPDFTRLTEKESAELKKAEASGFVSDKDIDWDHLSEVYGK